MVTGKGVQARGQRLQALLIYKDHGVSIVLIISPGAHVGRINSVTNALLANLRLTYINLNKQSFIALYTAYIRLILECVALVWNTLLIKQIKNWRRFRGLMMT